MTGKETVNAALRQAKADGHTVACMVSLPSGGAAIASERTVEALMGGLGNQIKRGEVTGIGTGPVHIDRLIKLTD